MALLIVDVALKLVDCFGAVCGKGGNVDRVGQCCDWKGSGNTPPQITLDAWARDS